jgi:hypothetical protein
MERDWPTDWPTERIMTVAQADSARYLDPSETVRLAHFPTGHESIVARSIIEVGGLYLVESVDDPDNWYMGQRMPDGVLECWGQYGDLESALRSL